MQKTIENKHFIHYLKRFPQTSFVCFCNANIYTQVSVFSYSCPKVSVLVHFQESLRWLFPIQTVSSVWSYIFLLNGPDKKPKQNSSKTKRHSQQQEAKSVRRRTAPPSVNETFFGALSQGLCAYWLVCIVCCIFWHLIGSD